MNDEIYQVPLSQFAAVRDQMAGRLKASGDKGGSAELKRARKPSVPAWAANQVVWKAPDAWRRLQTAVEALRKSHEENTSAEDVRQASREQREALRYCEARAADILGREGHAASPAVLEKVGNTLLALALGAPGVTPGRLDHELQPPGFEALAGLSIADPEPRAAPTSIPASVSEKAPVAARQDAEGKAGDEERDEERARRAAALAAAEAQMENARRMLEDARSRLASDEERLRALEGEMTGARRSCEESRRRVDVAESEHAASEAALEALRSRAAS